MATKDVDVIAEAMDVIEWLREFTGFDAAVSDAVRRAEQTDEEDDVEHAANLQHLKRRIERLHQWHVGELEELPL